MRFDKKFGDVASGRDSFAVVTAQKIDHRVAVLDDSCVLLGRDLNVIFGAAGFDTGTPVAPAQVLVSQRKCVLKSVPASTIIPSTLASSRSP